MTTFESDTLAEVNDAFLELTGYTRDEVVGKTSRELEMWSSPEDRKKLNDAEGEDRGFRNLELKLRSKEGLIKTILMSAEVIELGGDRAYKMFYDLTARKQTEEQLHQAIQEVMSDASWFSRSLLEQLSRIRRSGDGEAPVVVDLSRRERQVLERLAGGASNEAIAADLGLSAQTIRNYISNVYDKLGVHSRAEAIVWARERGIVG